MIMNYNTLANIAHLKLKCFNLNQQLVYRPREGLLKNSYSAPAFFCQY